LNENLGGAVSPAAAAKGRQKIRDRVSTDPEFANKRRENLRRAGKIGGGISGRVQGPKLAERIKNDPEFREKHRLFASRAGASSANRLYRDPKLLESRILSAQKMAERNRGRSWITDGKSNRRVYSNAPIPAGWKRGVTQKARPISQPIETE
jgi:hypothetical protein